MSGGISVERLCSADVYTDTAPQAYSTMTTKSSADADLNNLCASKCPVCLPYISETVLSATARVYRMHVGIFNTMHKVTAPHIKASDCSEQLNAQANARALYVVRGSLIGYQRGFRSFFLFFSEWAICHWLHTLPTNQRAAKVSKPKAHTFKQKDM